MITRYAWLLCLLTACASSVVQDPPQDPGSIPDASADAPPTTIDAGSLAIGLACSTDADCGDEQIRCLTMVPGGYCSNFCSADAECPTGSVCAPIPFSRVSGTCMKSCTTTNECRDGYACGTVYLFTGQPNGPSSSTPVCWEAKDAGP